MKENVLISLLIWIIAINLGKVWPLSKGEIYYRNLQKWYVLANKGQWSKANLIEKKLESADIKAYSQQNKGSELLKKIAILENRERKNADDFMEMAVLYYKVNNREAAFKAIESAYKLDPIREDISKIYFTYQTSLLPR